MISYRCYKTCPVCGKTTLRLIEGTAERGLWECEGWRRVLDAWAGVSLVFPKEKCPGRVDERYVYKWTSDTYFELRKAKIEAWRVAPDPEAKEREFWDTLGEAMRWIPCRKCPACKDNGVCGLNGPSCASTLRAYYERNFGGWR
jgi:hypothetical protein